MSATAPPKLSRGPALRAAQSFDVGTVIDKKYRIEALLGRGGMAFVVAATHVSLGHRVAIKLLLPEVYCSPDIAQRVLREARAASGLTSETVTRVLDVDTLDSGEPYIVMERLYGLDLGRLLEENGPLSLSDVATFLVQASEAVAEAHARGIIHRDLKPSNLFLTKRSDGSRLVKLMDFGISKVIEANSVELTHTTESLGTPHYMSPEQLLTSRGVDTRTDVWALGVILYRLLTGEYPFNGETVPAVHIAVASEQAPKLRSKRPDVPVEIGELFESCLAKERENRLSSVQAFAAALLPFADAETRKRYAHLAPFGRRGLSRRARRGLLFAMGLVVLVAGVIAGAKLGASTPAASAAPSRSASNASSAPIANGAIAPEAPATGTEAAPGAADAPASARSASPLASSTSRRRLPRPPPGAPPSPAPSPSPLPADPYGERR